VANNLVSVTSDSISNKNESPEIIKKIKNRRSKEIVIGLCGAIGSGVKQIKNQLIEQLTTSNYIAEDIVVSDLLANWYEKDVSDSDNYERYKKLQDMGDDLRKSESLDFLAQLVTTHIAVIRENNFPALDDKKLESGRVAFVVDQLKHPSEIDFLRELYGSSFYQLGVLRSEYGRRDHLERSQNMSQSEITEVMERDRKSQHNYGQHVEKSLHRSDFFIQNRKNKNYTKEAVERFIRLMHDVNHETPTQDEIGMFGAYSASLRSACLSRQVGAVIMDGSNIISTGYNDVPKFGGGLYQNSDEDDNRCFNHQESICHNDKHKEILVKEIESVLKSNNVDNSDSVANKILENTKAKSIIEYSRAIHAEMAAIMAVAASGNASTQGKVMYCTTFPCHICARHIVASGIEKVIYIEPYEKSLALDLHGDAITTSVDEVVNSKVVFQNFQGVSPKRYAKFFEYNAKRKDTSGKAQTNLIASSNHAEHRHLDAFHIYEKNTAKHVESRKKQIELAKQ
jgi:deoxycytidylate deaminase